MAYFVFPAAFDYIDFLDTSGDFAAFRLLDFFDAFVVFETFDHCVSVFRLLDSIALMCFMFLMFFDHIIFLMLLLF